MTAIVIGASLRARYASRAGRSSSFSSRRICRRAIVVGGAVLVSSPFWIGLVRVSRVLGFRAGGPRVPRCDNWKNGPGRRAAPAADRDLATGDRAVGRHPAGGDHAAVRADAARGGACWCLCSRCWRSPFGETPPICRATPAPPPKRWSRRSAGRRARAARWRPSQLATQQKLDDVNRIITGLGSPVSIELKPGSSAVGRTLAEVKLRGLTGATILAIERGGESVVVPAGNERLRAGDVLAVAGTHLAVEAARELLAAEDIDHFSNWRSPHFASGWIRTRARPVACRFGTAAPLSVGASSNYGVRRSHVDASPGARARCVPHSSGRSVPRPPPRHGRAVRFVEIADLGRDARGQERAVRRPVDRRRLGLLDRNAAGGAGPQRDRAAHAGRQNRRHVAAALQCARRPPTNMAAGPSWRPDGTVYFSNYADQRIWRFKPGASPSRSRPRASCGSPTTCSTPSAIDSSASRKITRPATPSP